MDNRTEYRTHTLNDSSDRHYSLDEVKRNPATLQDDLPQISTTPAESIMPRVSLTINELFDDPITYSAFVNPHVAPSGYTYDFDGIKKWIDISPTDPLNRSPLQLAQLRKDKLLAKLYEKIHSPADFKALLQCPLTGRLFAEPVIADDGNTYEYSALKKHVKKHRNLPGQHQRLKNISVLTVFKNRLVKQIINSLNLLSEKQIKAVLPLYEYLVMRWQENNKSIGECSAYSGTIFGWSYLEKITVANHLIDVVYGIKDPTSFFSNPLNLKIAQQGRLGFAAEAGLTLANVMLQREALSAEHNRKSP